MADLGPLALAEVIRRTTEQQQTLTATRTAAGTILSASTVGSAFLAGIALDGVTGLPSLGWLAVIATATTAVLAMLTFLPLNVGVITDPEVLDRDEWKQHTDNDAALHLAKYINKRANDNEDSLDHRWWLVIAAGITTTASIVLWIAAIATR